MNEEKKSWPVLRTPVTNTDVMKCSRYISYTDVMENLEVLEEKRFSLKTLNKIVNITFYNLCGVRKVEIESNGLIYWTYNPKEGESFQCEEWQNLEHIPTSIQLSFSGINVIFTPRILADSSEAKITGGFGYRKLFDFSPVVALDGIPIFHHSENESFLINGGVMGKCKKGGISFNTTIEGVGFTPEEVQEQLDFLLSPKDFEPILVEASTVLKRFEEDPEFQKAFTLHAEQVARVVEGYERPEGLRVFKNGKEIYLDDPMIFA